MKKQTAVDFLIEKIIIADVKGYSLQMSKLTEWAKEARQIEKEQIQIAYDMGWHRANKTKDKAYITAEDFGENYFTKKYGK